MMAKISTGELDTRLNAFRKDLADMRLEGQVNANEFVEGQAATIIAPVADLFAVPQENQSISHQLLLGDKIRVFEIAETWSWVQTDFDEYVGYLKTAQINNLPMEAPTHVVCVPSTFVYPGPELKAQPICTLSMGSAITISDDATNRGTSYFLQNDGTAIFSKHLREIKTTRKDYVEACAQLLNVPYLWGGASGFGIDCSGLVQLAMREAGICVPRDTDLQLNDIGLTIEAGSSGENLRRGDLVFWQGHVAIVEDNKDGIVNIIHANGNTMSVAREPLLPAIKRIAYLYGNPIGYRRPLHLV